MKDFIASIFVLIAICQSCFADTQNPVDARYIRINEGMIPAQVAGHFFDDQLKAKVEKQFSTKEIYVSEFCRLANASDDGACITPTSKDGQRFAASVDICPIHKIQLKVVE